MIGWLLGIGTALGWTLGEPHDLDQAVDVNDPLVRWSIDRGTLFPVLDDDAVPSGFVWVGEGDARLTLAGRTAQATANRLVGLLDWDVADATAVTEAGVLPVGIDGAVVLGIDAWGRVADHVRPIHGDDVLYTVGDDGIENVLVMRRREVDQHRRQARTWLDRRERWWDEHLVEPAGLITADRWTRDAGLDHPGRWVASLHTDVDWGRFAGDLAVPRVVQPWLEVLVDPTGVVSPGDRALAWAFGHSDDAKRLVASEAFPGDAAPRRLELVGIGATVRFDPSPASVALELSAAADVMVQAIGGDAATAVIDVPHTQQEAWRSMPPLPHGFELIEITDDQGRVLQTAHVSIGRQDEDRGDWRTYAVRLAEVLPEGEAATLRVRFRDRHRFSHMMENQLGAYNYGSVTELVRVLPMLRGTAATTAPATVQVGVSPLLPDGTEAIAAGEQARRWTSQTGRWVQSSGFTRGMRVAVGRWHAEDRPGPPDIAVRALHANRQQEKIPRTVHEMLDLVAPMHPDLPRDTLTVLEGASELYETRVEAADGIVMHHEVQDGTDQLSTLDGARVLIALHQQWWSGLEVPSRDADLPEALAHVYALEAVRAVDGERAGDVAWDAQRTFRTEAPELAWVLGPVLQARTGTSSTLFAAVDRVLRGEYPPSREGLAEALEAVTGADFDDFFVVWADTGLTPRVQVQWEPDPAGAITGTVTTDLPFGRVDVPLQVGRGKRQRVVVVPVVDGAGRFEVPWVGGKRGVRVDPGDALPLRQATVKRGGGDALSEAR